MADQPLLFDDEELEDAADGGSGGSNGDRPPVDSGDPLRTLIDEQFMQYAAYVIRDRAIPDLADGLKPVQRRILWSLHEKDDGKFTKVANIVGHCMQYHPHGDGSINDALVTLTNKIHLIEGQGNFGNIHTGDPAAASRYIECRLTDAARQEIFNDDLTRMAPSYDSRRKEPVALPTRLPLLLMLGAEGIAVGLSTRILPHNFRELLEAQVAILRKKPFQVFPDFVQGGLMDVTEYEKGHGRVRLRALVEKKDEETLVVREIPFGSTTDSLVGSIEAAGKKGKIKIQSIQDFTAEKIEIEIQLHSGQDADRAIQALYAFTQCEMAVNSHVIVIDSNRPVEMNVDQVLRANTRRFVSILKRELEWNRRQLEDEVHRKTLVQLFVENRIYKRIEECESYPEVQDAVRAGFKPLRDRMRRDLTDKDVEMLLGIPIKRISRFDIERNRQEIGNMLREIEVIDGQLANLTDYAVRYLRRLLKTYAEPCERRTRITRFDAVEIREITVEDIALQYDRAKGYLGTEIAGDDQIIKCLSYDKIVVVWDTGAYKVINPPDRLYIDSNVLYIAVADRDRLMTLVYEEGLFTYIKRFSFGGSILNRRYNCASKDSQVLYFSDAQPERLYVKYKKVKRLRILEQEYDVSKIAVKGVKARGNQMTSKKIRLVTDTRPRGWPKQASGPRGTLLS
jgi:topoisomerase-4 subunit A